MVPNTLSTMTGAEAARRHPRRPSLVDLQLDQALVTVEGDAHHRPGAAGRRGVAHLLGTQQ
jgi:hypothetical protein